jgi:hypothetical protein
MVARNTPESPAWSDYVIDHLRPLYGVHRNPRTQWHRSASGNLTRKLPDGQWATVYRVDMGQSCVVYRWATGDMYSLEDYPTEALALCDLLAVLEGVV